MSPAEHCAECGASVPPDAPDGICPRCLAQATLASELAQPGLHFRCPHCQNPIELVDETQLADLTCPSCGSNLNIVPEQADTLPRSAPETMGHFRLDKKLGTGAFGTVWKAFDTELDRPVAVKIPRNGQLDAQESEQFLREARAAAQLNHAGIVSVHEVGRDGDNIYIVSDLVDGLTLADWLTGQRPSPREAAQLCAEIADALHHAHEHGVIHRDLKPSNIMLDAGGQPHVMDFGLAKRESAEITMTVDGKLLGTPAYMSPEQAHGEAHAADRRSDAYSLGVILFELLTGERPFRGNQRMLLHQVIHEDAPSPRKLNNSVPRDLETVCLKCLEKDPDRRYGTTKELGDELRRYLSGEPVSARPIGRVDRAWRWSKRRPAAATAMLLAVLLAVGGPLMALQQAMLRGKLDTANNRLSTSNQNLLQANDAERTAKNAAERRRQQAVTAQIAESEARRQAENVTEYLVEAFRTPDPWRDSRTITMAEVLDRIVEDLQDRFSDNPQTKSALLHAVGQSYWGLGLYNDSIPVFGRALDLRQRAQGEDHADTLASMDRLANAYHSAGRLDEAINLYEKSLTLKRAKLGHDHLETLTSMNNVAFGYQEAGRLDEAIPILEETLRLRRDKLGEHHEDTLTSTNNLAISYQHAGRLDEAITLHEKTLDRRKSQLGLDHPDTLTSMNNLATCYENAGRLAEAIMLHKDELQLCQVRLGPDHPDTLTAMNNLAVAYSNAGRLDEAISLFEESLKLLTAKLGEGHPKALMAMSNLANIYNIGGRSQDAVSLLDRTLELRKSTLGEHHPDTLMSMNNLALAHQNAGRLAEAITRHEETLTLMQTILGEHHPSTLLSMNNLALAYQGAGRLDEAIPMFEETLEHRRSKLGENHPHTLASMGNLAVAYQNADRLDEAIPLLEQSFQLMTAQLGEQHPHTLTAMNNLGVGYRDAGRLVEAIPLLEQTLQRVIAKLGEHHPHSLTAMKNLAACFLAAEQPARALPLYARFVAGIGARFGPDDPRLAGQAASVSLELLAHEQFSAAEKYLRECIRIRQMTMSDHWLLFSAKSMLGAALAGQDKIAEAEPLLVDGYQGMQQREAAIPQAGRVRLTEALERLIALYEASRQPEQAAKWSAELQKRKESQGTKSDN